MVFSGVKNGHQKDIFSAEIKVGAQNVDTNILGSIANTIGTRPYVIFQVERESSLCTLLTFASLHVF